MTDAIAAYSMLLKIGDGGTAETFTTIAEVRDLDGPEIALEMKEVTSHDSGGWREYIPTLLGAGEVTFKLNFVPTNATHGYSTGLLKDMTNRTKRNFKLVLPDTGATTWNFAAFVANFKRTGSVEDELSADVTLQITGQPTLA